MPLTLRPIDAIFRHPVKKFTVIYQNGKLWQLPQLDFDGGSLGYKRPYTGSREQIFVAQNQQLDPADTLLLSKLATIDLPVTVVGANVDEFEQWWAKKGFDYREAVAHSKARQQQAVLALQSGQTLQQAPLALSEPMLTRQGQYQEANQPQSQTPSEMHATPPAQVSVPPAGAGLADEADVFDAMLNDLTQDLL